ncbi:unnamed protein product [Rotaria socialis]|uniref:F-box domain-containing protein n=2 Tax=Rotaria socialis TaxID=392032 RepID=A0A818FES1_9BILA|nr:unnamed protein product [Rotaria socialis]CAF4828040.1 unnamed protein product [Rotaria socialis]
MPFLSCRRNSMALLKLYDLESLVIHQLPTPTDQDTSISNVEKNEHNDWKTHTSPPKLNFEDLPNELLLFIFQFLPIIDLQRAFYNLNLRINTICYSQEFKLDLTSLKPAFDYYCSSEQPFVSQIYSLKLSDEYDRLSLFNQHIDISHFHHLRAITIRQPSPENLDQILSKLHLLTELSYLNIYGALIQSPHITTALFSIRSLKCLILYSFDPIVLDFTDITICAWTKLEYLELHSCYMTSFLELIKYIGPNVKRMKIHINYKRRENPASIDEQIINNLLSGDGGRFEIPISLNRLDMSFYYLSLTDFHLVLKLFPNLRHLAFSTSTFDMNFASATMWYEFITNNLLELKKFQFYIQVTGDAAQRCPAPGLVELFNENHDKWIQGPVIMNYNHPLKPPTLEFYTYSQSAWKGKYYAEFYGNETYISTKSNIMDIYDNAKTLRITLNDNNNEQLTLLNQNKANYPKVTTIRLHSQMARSARENDSMNSLICSDLKMCFADLSKITGLDIPVNQPTNFNFPSRTLVRRLLCIMPKISRLSLPYSYLLDLFKAPLVIHMLKKRIDSVSITFNSDPPLLQDINVFLDGFSTNLRYLYMIVDTTFPVDNFYAILPSILDGKFTKLRFFSLKLSKLQGAPQTFSTEFKLWLKVCLTIMIKNDKKRSSAIEFNIKDSEFAAAF